MSITVQLSGLEPLLKQIDSIAKLEGVQSAMLAAGTHIKSKVDKYPKSTIANSPSNPTRRWYERGYGPRWRRKDGSMGGRKTSEMLNRKWTVATRDRGLTVVIGNNVSYGPYVQDKDHQARFHAERGWQTIQDVAEKEAPTVIRFIQNHMRKKFGMT